MKLLSHLEGASFGPTHGGRAPSTKMKTEGRGLKLGIGQIFGVVCCDELTQLRQVTEMLPPEHKDDVMSLDPERNTFRGISVLGKVTLCSVRLMRCNNFRPFV